MKAEDITPAGDTNVRSIVRIGNKPVQEPAIVNELLTQAIIDTLSSSSTLTDLDYTFFEGWRSKNGLPGFAVYGRDSAGRHQRGIDHVLSVKYQPLDIAQRTGIPERFMSGPEPVRPELLHGIEVLASSPLNPDPLDSRWDPSNPHQGLAQLLENLTSDADIDSKVTKPEHFYQQFGGRFSLQDSFDEKVMARLAEKDPLTNGGRYLLLVTSGKEGSVEFKRGNFVRASEGNYRGASITGTHHLDKNSTIGFSASRVIAIYGKGLEPLYLAKKSK